MKTRGWLILSILFHLLFIAEMGAAPIAPGSLVVIASIPAAPSADLPPPEAASPRKETKETSPLWWVVLVLVTPLSMAYAAYVAWRRLRK